ncbi:MAG: hypothetical protein LBH97_06910 [Treponema sp.]|jgi:hypothetical protein|nr:hypothetical protein [Treponema sp.]
MIIDVEAEVNKHRTCKDRSKLEQLIQEYKSLALQHAVNFTLTSQYNSVAFKLQEIYDRLPAAHIKNLPGSTHATPSKTAAITSEEKNRIDAAWKKKTGTPHNSGKR